MIDPAFFLKKHNIPPQFQCIHILDNGERCKNSPVTGKNKCYLHDGVKRNYFSKLDEKDKVQKDAHARSGTILFQDEKREMDRSLMKDSEKFTEDVLDWYLNWFNLIKDGTVEEKRRRVRRAISSFDWKTYVYSLDLEGLKHLGIKIFKIDFPNTSKKISMITRLSKYLQYKGAASFYNIRNYNNAKRAEIAKFMKGNTPKNGKNSPKSKNNSSKKENKSKNSPAKKSKNSPKKKASAPKS